ncbi:hypothetical protein FACS1894158_16050 [Betaproteobacteria bacterium]|nr:hypothetical protein FACS1894158_16050 [Betaproteobacteria bacterium]
MSKMSTETLTPAEIAEVNAKVAKIKTAIQKGSTLIFELNKRMLDDMGMDLSTVALVNALGAADIIGTTALGAGISPEECDSMIDDLVKNMKRRARDAYTVAVGAKKQVFN